MINPKEHVIDPILKEIPDLYPSCAVATMTGKLPAFPITNSLSSEYDLADSFLSRIFSDENNGFCNVSTTLSSGKICEDLDLDKKDLNGRVRSDKSQFSSDPSKDYSFNETLSFLSWEFNRAQKKKKKRPRDLYFFHKACLRMKFLHLCGILFLQIETCLCSSRCGLDC